MANSSMVIHNREDSAYWLIQIDRAVVTDSGEAVSFTVALKRDPALTVPEIERRAAARAARLLELLADPVRQD